jgi:hypothetical protein
MFDNRYSSEHRNGHRVASLRVSKHRERLTTCTVDLSPEVLREHVLTAFITKCGPAHRHAFDKRFAAKEQQHLEFLISVTPCPVSLAHLRFIRLVDIGRNHFRNERLYISAWETVGSLVE